MEIEKKNRDPTVRNIERLAPETQVDTEVLENQAGLKTKTQGGIQTLHDDTEADANSGGKGGGHNSSGGGRRRTRAPTPDQLKRKKYIIADADSDGSAAIEIGQSFSDAVDTMIQTGGTIRTAVQKSATGIGKIHTMVKHGVRLGTARDVGKVAANIGSGIRTGIADTAKQTGTGLLKTKIDKSTTTDTGTEAIKQGLTDLRYADNTRKALQNTARGSIKATRAIRDMPRETRAQVQRIRKRAQKTGQAAKKSADAVRRVLSTKAGRIVALGGLVVFLSVFLLNGLLTVIVSAAASLFSWLAPDGDTADTTMQSNIRTYISQIQGIEAEEQREVNGIADSLSPEYKYDGTQITGLNRFGNRTVQPYDNKAVLAVLAVQKFRTVQETGTANFTFTQDEIRNAVEQFYTLDYRYEYGYCPGNDCAKDSNCTLSLADGGFRIYGTSYDSEDNSYNVTLTGPTYTHASSMSTKLDFRMNGGGSIGGTAAADVGGGTWSVTYCIVADAYDHIDWSKCYLTVDTVYCNNPNHKYLYGQVVNLTESQAMTKAGFTADEKQVFQAYLEQIRAIGG
ncbi:MAG: hypothetical protein IKI45_10380 [Oscillospiraceae bacterium]|nr:hypothetical protein [Oscillospiraceae bacterium]